MFQDISDITEEKLALGDLVEEDGKFFYSSTNVFRILEEKGTVRQGPSKADQEHVKGRLPSDRVYAYPCRSWPTALSAWAERKRKYDWPSPVLIYMAKSKGCFLVPVGHKRSSSSHIEWRLSPSLAERILMFSLSETHIKCYVLLKHIVSYVVKPAIGQSLNSFHCKTAVLTLAENTPWEIWKPDRLLECMDMCIGQLILWCDSGWCPQYMLPQENLFAGRISAIKLRALKELLLSVYNSKWKVLKSLGDWELGETLQLAVVGCPYVLSVDHDHDHDLQKVRKDNQLKTPSVTIEGTSNESLFQDIMKVTEKAIDKFVTLQWPVEVSKHTLQILIDADNENVETCFKNLVAVWQSMSADKERMGEAIIQDMTATVLPFVSLYTGSVISSLPGRRDNTFWWQNIYAEWIQPAFKECRVLTILKVATILLSRGVELNKIMNTAERLLSKLDTVQEQDSAYSVILNQLVMCHRLIEESGDEDDLKIIECLLDHAQSEYLVARICICPCRGRFGSSNQNHNIQHEIQFTPCIFFMRGEMNIVLYPLKFEFYRSSAQERDARNVYNDMWMDLAAIDVAPYTYYLQYECYRAQNKTTKAEKALLNLIECVCEDDLFHRETALNLVGHSQLLEGKIDMAFNTFKKSLEIQRDNNCAVWHIGVIVNKLLKGDIHEMMKKDTDDIVILSTL